MRISQAGHALHTVIHPMYHTTRDPGGHLLTLAATTARLARPKSFMRFEDRPRRGRERSGETQAGHPRDARRRARKRGRLGRDAHEDARDRRRHAERNMPVDADGVAEAQEISALGRERQLHVPWLSRIRSREGRQRRSAQSGRRSGLGILRGEERSLAPRSLRTLAAKDLPQSGSDGRDHPDQDERARERASSGLHGLHRRALVRREGRAGFRAALPRPLHVGRVHAPGRKDVPLVRRKVEAVMQRSGFRRDSHSGKALRHILETLPARRAVPVYRGRAVPDRDRQSSRSRIARERGSSSAATSTAASIRASSICRATASRAKCASASRRTLKTRAARRARRLDDPGRRVAARESSSRRASEARRQGDVRTPPSSKARSRRSCATWHDELRDTLVQKHGRGQGTQARGALRSCAAGRLYRGSPRRTSRRPTSRWPQACATPTTSVSISTARVARPDTLHLKVFRLGADIAPLRRDPAA